MKKTMGKLKQALSIVLAAAMIVTCLPQTGMSVIAAEEQNVESSDEPDVFVDAAEDETNESNESTPVGDETDEPEEADTEEKAEEETTISKYDAGEEGAEEEGSLKVTVEAPTGENNNYSVVQGEYKNNRQYFTIEPSAGYMISPDNDGTVTIYKGNQVISAQKGEKDGEYYIELTETSGEIKLSVLANVVKAVNVTIQKAGNGDNAVKNIEYTYKYTAAGDASKDADWAPIDLSESVAIAPHRDLKIKFKLEDTHTVEVTAGERGDEKVITPVNGIYTVKNITADTKVIITTIPIQYNIETIITVNGKNVTEEEIEEIQEEINGTLVGNNRIDSLLRGSDLELSELEIAKEYYIKSVQCKVGSTAKAMTYDAVDEVYRLTAAEIAKTFSKLQDGDTITVVINMEKAWKVTFDLEGVTVKDARNIDPEMWYDIDNEEILYVKKGSSLALIAEMDEGDGVQLREAWYQAGTKKTDIKSKVNGSKFSITITADTIITIKSTAKESYALEFNNEDPEIITDLRVTWKDQVNVSGNDLVLEDIAEGEVTSKNKITFRADAKPGYKKPLVTVEEDRSSDGNENWVRVKTLTPTTAGVYELTSLTADSRITITNAGLDDKTCNVLNIKPENENLSNAYTATLTVSGNDTPINLKSMDTHLAPLEETEAVLTINLQPGYENLVVKLDGQVKTPDVTGNDPEGYKITFTGIRKVQNIIVSAEEEEAEDATTVQFFASTAPHMSYKVVTTKDGPVTQVTDGKVSNTYKISKEGRSIQFTVTAASAYYVPVVKVNNDKNSIAPISVNLKTRSYTYNIAAVNISNEDSKGTIYISETSDVRKVAVSCDENAVEVSADVAGGEHTTNGDDGMVYSVTDGDTINFTVSVKDNYKLVNITAKNTTTGKETKVTKNIISVKADADYEVTVNTQPLTAINVYAVENADTNKIKVPVNKNKSYSVQYGTDYTVEVFNGANQAEWKHAYFTYGTMSKATVKDGTVTVKINRADAVNINKPKQLNLTLKDANKTAYTVTLELIPLAKVKKVDGVKTVNKENVLTQTVNTTKTYAITMDPATAADTLDVSVRGENTGVTAVVKGRMLEIKTATDTVKDRLATIELYDKTEEPGKEQALYSLYVTTAPPTLPTPTVALQNADDSTLTLTLGAKNLALPDDGTVYYKVVATRDEKTTAKLAEDQQKKVKESVTEYFEIKVVDSKGSTSQTEEVKVIEADFGSGFANTFDVTVTLVQSKSKKSINGVSDDTDDNILARSTKSVTKKGLKTKEPAYATKITFKKGASAVYTNQKDVLAATAVFDKNATHTTLIGEGSGAPVDLSYTGDQRDKALKISIVDGNQILVSADSKTAPGKHVIQVTADNGEGKGADTMRQTTADYTITVERAIEEIELNNGNFIPVYKASGKAVSFTVGITYNKSTTQPKAKKVNWTITDEDGNALSKEEARGVTVNNGKVTIPKDYILKEPDGEWMSDHFWVTATAADVTDNLKNAPVVSEPAEVYIYNQEISVGETILVKRSSGKKNDYEVIARSGGIVTAKELEGAEIFMLKKGAVGKSSYTVEELTGDGDYKSLLAVDVDMAYKVSNRAIVLEGNVVKEVNGGNLKNVTITATTADGSNLKSELKNLTVNYYAPEEYGLEVKQMTPWEAEETQVLHKNESVTYTEYYFNGALDTIFEFQVKEKLEGAWKELSAASDYTLAVTGASILEKDVIKGTYTIIGNNAKITVKLTDKTKKAPNNVTTFTFYNRTVSTAKAPTLKVLTKGDLIAGTYCRDQQIRYSLTNLAISDPSNTHVLITLDAKDSTNIKNQARYKEFEKYCGGFLNNTSYTVKQLAEIGLVFTGEDGMTDIPAGTYKLTVNFGEIKNDGSFVAIAKPVTLTVKASAPKKASVKLNSDYTLSINNAAAGAVLTLNNRTVKLIGASVVNDNVNGKENDFTKYFEISKGKDGTFVLKIRDNLSIDDLNYIKDTKKAKNDLTGWVTYTYDDGIFKPETVQAQIKVKGYAEPKYIMESGKSVVKASEGDTTTIRLAVTAGGDQIKVARAYTEAPGLVVREVGDDGTVTFIVTDTAKNAAVYIVPETSAYVKVLDDLKESDAEGASYKEALKTYGVKVTTSVTLMKSEDAAKATFMTFNVKSAAFDNNRYFVNDSTSGNDPDYKGRYWVHIPFTKNIVEAEAPEVKVTEIKAGNISIGQSGNDVFVETGIGYEDSTLGLDIVKTKLEELVQEEIVTRGGKITVTVTATHQGGVKKDYTFTLTLPKYQAAPKEYLMRFVNDEVDWMERTKIEMKDWQVGTIKAAGSLPGDQSEKAAEMLKNLRMELYYTNVEELQNLIIELNQYYDSGIWFKMPHWYSSEDEWVTFQAESFGEDSAYVMLPTTSKEGVIKYTIIWEDTEVPRDNDNRTGTIEVVCKIAKLPAAPAELESELGEAITTAQGSLTLTYENQWEFEDILAAEVGKVLLENPETEKERKHLRVNAFRNSEAGGEQGSITFKVELRDIKYGGKIEKEVTFTRHTDDY